MFSYRSNTRRDYVIETGQIVLAEMSQNFLANPHIQAANPAACRHFPVVLECPHRRYL